MLISSPFEVPDYAEFIHVWRHFDLNNFDNHDDNGTVRPDAVYIELRNADTGVVVFVLDSWEALGTSENFDTIGRNFVNISRFKGMNLQLALNVIGHKNEVIDECTDGNDDDALVQIDDIYFTDANQNKIKPSFDYANIMSRIHPGDYESYFGIQEEIEGISLDKMDLISNMTYQQLKFLWEFPYGKDFRITLFNQT